MVQGREQYYFNGVKVSKHVLGKYIKWASILIAIRGGADNAELLKERLGSGAKETLHALKVAGMCSSSTNTRVATYSVTQKGEQLINDVKQYEKEKKDEEKRMFRDCE